LLGIERLQKDIMCSRFDPDCLDYSLFLHFSQRNVISACFIWCVLSLNAGCK